MFVYLKPCTSWRVSYLPTGAGLQQTPLRHCSDGDARDSNAAADGATLRTKPVDPMAALQFRFGFSFKFLSETGLIHEIYNDQDSRLI